MLLLTFVCELQVDEDDCDSDPCTRGTCSNGAPGTGKFVCDCPLGWTGPLCDIRMFTVNSILRLLFFATGSFLLPLFFGPVCDNGYVRAVDL